MLKWIAKFILRKEIKSIDYWKNQYMTKFYEVENLKDMIKHKYNIK